MGQGVRDVSRETQERLKAYEALLLKWSPKINMIAKADLPYIWSRHIIDSQQLVPLLPNTGSLCDLGSGGGLPGIVLSICLPDRPITLIESDQRKAVFLRTCVRELSLNATILAQRIESTEPQAASIVTARALAPLETLLPMVHRHLRADGTAILMKGRRADEEIARAKAEWTFDMVVTQSQTNPEASILTLKDISRA